MEDSIESVSSVYVQVGNALWIGNRSWGGEQRSLYRARSQHQAVTCMFVLHRFRE
jgi:hypothetical protein